MICPRCGRQNIPVARFCSSCGTPVPSQPFVQQPPYTTTPYYADSPIERGSSEAKIVLAVVLVILVVTASSFIVVYFAGTNLISSVKGLGPVQITNLTLYTNYPNSSDAYFGPQYRFLTLSPVYLQHGETYHVSIPVSLAGSSAAHSVDSIVLGFSDGFTIQSVNPVTPFSMSPGSSITLTVTLLAPNHDYSGSVTIDLFTH